jgi:hypothetical protein
MSMTLWPQIKICAITVNQPPTMPKPKHIPHPSETARRTNCRNCGASSFTRGKCDYCGSIK